MKNDLGTSPRERILATASDLFYKHGIHAVGIDRIIRESDVAKMTFYKHFPSKSNLVSAYLARKNNLWMSSLQSLTSNPQMNAAERVLAIFDVLDRNIQEAGFQGCPFAKALAEFGAADGEPEIQSEIYAHYEKTEALIAGFLREIDSTIPHEFLQSLMSLISGSIIIAQSCRRTDVARINKQIVQMLLAPRMPVAKAARLRQK